MKKENGNSIINSGNGKQQWQQDVAVHPIPEVIRKNLIPSELNSLQNMVLLITAGKVS